MKSPCSARSNHAARPAFSLIEILIAIIILSLGLLGLGALFPVVVRQQRISSDQTLGVIVIGQARAKLQLASWFAVPGVNVTAWEYALGSSSPFFGDRPWTSSATFYGEWEFDNVLADDLDPSRRLLRGDAVVGRLPKDNNSTNKVGIPLVERLYPAESPTPLLVWDFAYQAAPGVSWPGPGAGRAPMRAAVFVRRIDPRVRPPVGATLRQTLLNLPPLANPAEQRSPFGADADGRPTLDGTDGVGGWNYAGIRYARANFVFDPTDTNGVLSRRDRLYFPDATDTVFGLIRQPGQRLVDNLGNIYTVTSSGREPSLSDTRYVSVSPPVPGVVGLRQALNTPATGVAPEEAIREVIFTPQVPVAVGIVEVNK